MMTSPSKDKINPLENEYGASLHTALRKCCDSNWTSVAWNAVHLMDMGWLSYVRYIVSQKPLNADDLNRASIIWAEKVALAKLTGNALYGTQVFRIALRNFDEADWEGMAEYLGDIGK